MSYNKLPADPTAMILGIIGLVIALAGCCCGIFAVVPLVLGIIGLVMCNKSLREYHSNPDVYTPQSKSNVSTAKVLNLIALILGAAMIIGYIVYFAFYGVMASQMFKDVYEIQRNGDDYHYEWDSDSLYHDEETYEYGNDTISIDSIRIDDGEIIEVETAPLDSIN
ncbi:CCC motif membrane protein [Psychroserpens sp. SPM9]|uniref:CCC motif membrane protein n=1 Tax=Psychroserpens sp. SPM9 TaxID=2975598 RepID=UPI0021A3A3C6|nr:CCC motif membrane protein [Psychroserpens sp. SPM9]MDG5490457.1 CCC motif membrane protein [Psychroserpens sp. SPM9]